MASMHLAPALSCSPAVGATRVETHHGIIAVDATLTVSDARALREQAEPLGKPLLAVLLTHGHPDHYNGVGLSETEAIRGQRCEESVQPRLIW